MRIREQRRNVWGWGWLDDMLGDIRSAFRQCARSPGFTAVCVITLAVGIGLNAAVFAVADLALFNGFPQIDPDDRVVYVSTARGISYPDFDDWRSRARSFAAMGVVGTGGLRYHLRQASGASAMVDVTRLSVNSFDVFEQPPLLGRTFLPADQAPGAPPVAILHFRCWEQNFAKDPAVIGRAVTLNGEPTTIIGVMPPGVNFPHYRVDVWLPLDGSRLDAPRDARRLWFAFGRLSPGADVESARAELEVIGRTLAETYPDTNQDVRPEVKPFRNAFFGTDAVAFHAAMWGAASLVLLIVCANIASLLVARSDTRSRELAVRMALGAGRWRVVRQLLIESLLLSIAGAAIGCVVALAALEAYGRLATAPDSYARWEFAVDWKLFAYLAVSSVVAGLLFGLAPARRVSRVDVITSLKHGGRTSSAGPNGRRLAAAMVTAEMALALMVLAMASVMIRSLVNIASSDIGVRTDHVLTASIALPSSAAVEAPRVIEGIRKTLQGLPGAESVAVASALPTNYAQAAEYELSGPRLSDAEHSPQVFSLVVSDGYFDTLGISMRGGRDFREADRESGLPVAIVNERFARLAWPDVDAVGQRLRLHGAVGLDDWRVVVGVVSNVVQNQPIRGTSPLKFDPLVYVPATQQPLTYAAFVARTSVPPASLVTAFERVLLRAGDEAVVGSGLGPGKGPAPLTESLAFQYWSKGFNGGLFTLFGGIALALAALGLYAVASESINARRRELGIRTALGAAANDILSLVVRQGMRPVLWGLAIGLAGTLLLLPLLKSQLVDVSPTDPVSLSVAAAVLLAAALLGCWIPARRALRLDPTVALRQD